MNYMKAILGQYYLILETHPIYQQEVTEEQVRMLSDEPSTTVEPPAPCLYRKDIQYSYETRDYAMYLDGELVGFARTYHEAEVTLDQLVFDLMTGEYFREEA